LREFAEYGALMAYGNDSAGGQHVDLQ